ncbi:MAG: toll/interleukin-1 receptor domain-containing protein [Rhodobacteraceae bacterium]|nr:toll/interleukin-1 receptor domain-containing protein [Paracoccaceae bacterium]
MTTPKVFISYAHLDEPEGRDEVKWRTYVECHLRPLQKTAQVTFWSDDNLRGSQDWQARILAEIDSCDIFVLLVSPHSLGSDFITKTEVPRILDRQRRNSSTEVPAFYPILITPSGGLDGFRWLRTPNMRPKGRKALSQYEHTEGKNERDTVMARIVDDLAKLARELTAGHAQPAAPTPNPAQQPISPVLLSKQRRIVDGNLYTPSQDPNRVVLEIGFIPRAVATINPKGNAKSRARKPVRVICGVSTASVTATISSGRITEARTEFAKGHNPPRTAVIVQPAAGRMIRYFDIHSCDGATLSGNPLRDAGETGDVELFSIEGADPDMTVTAQVNIDFSGLQVEEEDQVCTSEMDQAARASQLRALAKLVLKKHGSAYQLGGVSK